MYNDKCTNKESPVFLYEQVKIGIKDQIANEEIVRGDRLPSENELCSQFNASRITVRRALKELESEGIIEIIHGKGTFVKGMKRPIHILNLEGYTEGLSTGENNSFTKEIISKKIRKSNELLMEKFNRKNPFEVVELVRIIKDGHDVFSLDYAYLPTDLYPGIFDKLKDNLSTFKIIHGEYGIKFTKANKEIETSLPNGKISELIGISNLDPTIKVKKLIKGDAGTPVHYSEYYLLADRVNLYIDVDLENN